VSAIEGFFRTPPATKDEMIMTDVHVMVDIETMGTSPTAPVISIGAVLFNPRQQDSVQGLEKRSFFARVDVEDAAKHSGGVEPGTLKWWLTQEDAAIKALVTGEAVALRHALSDFRQYCSHRWPAGDDKFFPGHSQLPLACLVWANSPNFDCTILEHACASVGEVFPFRFFQYRDLRTLKDLAWPGGPDDVPKFQYGTAHDARADAVNQALIVQAGYKELGLGLSDVKFSTF
jgi:hypothetical protein